MTNLTVWFTRAATRNEKLAIGLSPKAAVTACLDHKRNLIGICHEERPLWVAAGVSADDLERVMTRRLIGWPQPVHRPDLALHNIAAEVLAATRPNSTPRMGAPEWISPVLKLRMKGHTPKGIRRELEAIASGVPTHSPLCRELLTWIAGISDQRAEVLS